MGPNLYRFYKTFNNLLKIIFSYGCQCCFVNGQKWDQKTNNKVKIIATKCSKRKCLEIFYKAKTNLFV